MILGKNDPLFPLRSARTIAVIGTNADAPRNLMGNYSYLAGVELAAHPPAPELGIPTLGGLDWDYIQAHSEKILSILEKIRDRAGRDTEVLHTAGGSVSGETAGPVSWKPL